MRYVVDGQQAFRLVRLTAANTSILLDVGWDRQTPGGAAKKASPAAGVNFASPK